MPHRCLTVSRALSLVAVLLLGVTATAQERIPQSVITATGVMSQADKDAVASYLNRWAGVFKEAVTNEQISDSAISEARDRLVTPVGTPGATDLFKGYYSRSTAQQLTPLLKDKRLIVRLNAMIVATRLTDASAIDMGRAGLADESPAVRYWAAKAISNLSKAVNSAGEPILDTRLKLQLLRELADAGANEDSSEVLLQLFEGMAGMDLPSAPDRVMDLLGARLRFHVDRPYEPYLAESAGLRATYRQLLERSTRGNIDPAHVRKLAAVAHRYLNLISNNLADAKEAARPDGSGNPVTPQLEADHRAMLELCDFALQFCHEQSKSTATKPKSLDSMIAFRQWREIHRVVVEDWGKILAAPPFNLLPGELAIVGE